MPEKSTKSKSKPKSSKSKSTSSNKAKAPKKATTKAKTPKKATTKAKTPKKATTKAKKTTPTKKTKKKRKVAPTVETKPQKPRRLPLEKPVKGVLLNFQRGSIQQRPQYGLIQLEGVSSISQAAYYIGRSVIIHFNDQTSNHGRVVSVHGRNGVLRVRFRRGLAPEAIAKEILVY
ncbi:MAG: 50S ribosomal protein L35ae [Promethearchaeota archaeon]